MNTLGSEMLELKQARDQAIRHPSALAERDELLERLPA